RDGRPSPRGERERHRRGSTSPRAGRRHLDGTGGSGRARRPLPDEGSGRGRGGDSRGDDPDGGGHQEPAASPRSSHPPRGGSPTCARRPAPGDRALTSLLSFAVYGTLVATPSHAPARFPAPPA